LGGVFTAKSPRELDRQREAKCGGRSAHQFIFRVFESTRVVDEALPVAVGYVLAGELATPHGAIAALGVLRHRVGTSVPALGRRIARDGVA
jgi:hypothetical protein